MRRAPGESTAGFVPYTNELILSGHFQKKVVTVNYDFPGYRYACQPGTDPAISALQKNNFFFRERTSPGLYAPLLLVPIYTSTGAAPTTITVANADKNKMGSGSASILFAWDNSAAAFASGTNDRNRYVSSIGADDGGTAGYAVLTLNGAMSWTPQDTVDCLCATAAGDLGIIDYINYVIIDQEIDLRAAAQPAAIGANFAIDALYVARVNQRKLNGYDIFPAAFLSTVAAACQRLIFDNPQI
ncbi:MAG: hypothetical protein ABIH76_07370 [Candidatus Bathyarchaeota archaeon]